MRSPMMTTMRVMSLGAPVLASTVLVCTVGAVLPPLAGLALFVGGLAITTVLALGRAEPVWAELVCRGRPLAGWEADAVAPAVSLLCARGVGPPLVDLYVADNGQEAAVAVSVGRRTVVMSSTLVGAVQRGQLSAEQAAGVLAHAVGRLRVHGAGVDLALEFWTLPWQLIGGLAATVGRTVARLPLIGLAWRFRFVVASVAVVQEIGVGQVPVAVMTGIVIALSYLLPRSRRSWSVRVTAAADTFVAEHTLGEGLASYLGRTTRARLDSGTLARIDRLTSGSRPSPPLARVRTSPTG